MMSTPTRLQVEAKLELLRRNSARSLNYFIYHVFSESFENEPSGFVGGKYINWVAQRMDKHRWTMDVTGRDHFKSMRFYAEIMRDIFCSRRSLEAHYFSYKTDLAGYHLQKIKQLIQNNWLFDHIVDNKPTSETILDYSNYYGARYKCDPAGLLAFKRGIHADRIYIDDPLRDPENKLDPKSIRKINRTIVTEIYPMIKSGGICRIVGTPQTKDDFFFDKKLRKRWSVEIKDTIIDDKKGVVLWPEWKSYQQLQEIRETMGDRLFNQEYRCVPAYEATSFIDRKRLLAVVNPKLKNARLEKLPDKIECVAGFDIGKKVHPSHLAVYQRTYTPKRGFRYRQVLSKWFDGVDYDDQVEYLNMVCELLNIHILRYDNTRGEFESYAERGELHPSMQPVALVGKKRQSVAVDLEKAINRRRAQMMNDTRQINQILAVDNNLEAVTSDEGHGDSFWSNALALCEGGEKKEPNARTI